MTKRILKETALVLLLSVAFAAGSYTLRPQIPWNGSNVANATSEGPTTVNAAQAKAIHESGQVLFVDARDSFDFDMGHIPGAINIALDDIVMDEALPETLSRHKDVVTYCDNPLCGKAEKLATLLKEKGYAASVFPGGYQQWVESGWKTEGAQ